MNEYAVSALCFAAAFLLVLFHASQWWWFAIFALASLFLG